MTFVSSKHSDTYNTWYLCLLVSRIGASHVIALRNDFCKGDGRTFENLSCLKLPSETAIVFHPGSPEFPDTPFSIPAAAWLPHFFLVVWVL